MVKTFNKNIIFLIVLTVIFSGCSNLKYLKPGEVLYTGADVKINPESKEKIKKQKSIQKELKDKTRPKPNKKTLGLRFKLYMYNIAGDVKKTKGLRYWLKNKVGEPPVLLRTVNINYNNQVLQSYMESKGYLQATSEGRKEVKGKKGRAFYTVKTGSLYQIKNIHFPQNTDTTLDIYKVILKHSDKTLLKSGNPYDLDIMKQERERIDKDLKEEGYFYFNPDFLIFQVDSTIGDNKVDLYVRIKNNVPQTALKPYVIRNVDIYPNYTLEQDSIIKKATPVAYKGFIIHDPFNKYKPQLFEKLVFFEKNETYNRTDHNLTLNRLVNIGTFKFVKVEFNPVDTFATNRLDANVVLTSLKTKSLNFNVLGTSKSNNFVGSEVKVGWLHRNLLKAAEQLNISVSGGFEKQIGGNISKVNAYSLSSDVRLIFPRFIMPIYNFKTVNSYVPKTHIRAGAQFLKKAGKFSYSMISGYGEFGYIWKGNSYNEHILNPIHISYIRTMNMSEAFKQQLEDIPTLKKNYESQYIIGANYEFSFNNQSREDLSNTMSFTGQFESSGNIINLMLPKNESGQKVLASVPVNQYVRANADFKNYYKLTKTQTLAARLNIGVGYPYGNSTILPYIRQFFGGGSNDVRAFAARSLGPGTFNINKDGVKLFADQGGDIKLLFSAEYRPKFNNFLQGAVFLDAGNVWLSRKDTVRVGGMFKFNSFMKELAMGAGIGLRVDARIFLIRFDIAVPLRKPYLPEGQRWVIDKFDLSSKQWRRENLVLNIGIGYPF